MQTIGVIPARWASTRFEGKVLAEIQGKPMIQHVWERAGKSKLLDDLIIATDDERVIKAAGEFGSKAILTSPDHETGTDRIAEAIENIPCDIVVNIQGDEPLVCPQIIDSLIKTLKEGEGFAIATMIKAINQEDDLENPNVVKVVVDGEMNALYFSRSLIPNNRDSADDIVHYKHIGIYAYREEFLRSFRNLPKSNLEKAECLEQLRALEYGFSIKAVITDYETVGVDTKEDLKKVLKVLENSSKAA